jgi:hypothetical protein
MFPLLLFSLFLSDNCQVVVVVVVVRYGYKIQRDWTMIGLKLGMSDRGAGAVAVVPWLRRKK